WDDMQARLDALRAQRRAQRLAGFDDRALAWLALVPAWSEDLARICGLSAEVSALPDEPRGSAPAPSPAAQPDRAAPGGDPYAAERRIVDALVSRAADAGLVARDRDRFWLLDGPRR